MKQYRGILILGIIEVLIGGLTLCGISASILLGINTKTPNVLTFVITTATLSTLIGIGLLHLRLEAYKLLYYFSSVVFISKILFLMDIIRLNGALTTFIPGTCRHIFSAAYHAFIIYYLRRPEVKKIFRL